MLKLGGRDMLTLCVRELRFMDELLRTEEEFELAADPAPEEAGEGAPIGGDAGTSDPPNVTEFEGGCCCC